MHENVGVENLRYTFLFFYFNYMPVRTSLGTSFRGLQDGEGERGGGGGEEGRGVGGGKRVKGEFQGRIKHTRTLPHC